MWEVVGTQTRVVEMKRKGWDSREVGPQRAPDGMWGEGPGEVFSPRGQRRRRGLWRKQMFALAVLMFSHYWDTHGKTSSMILEDFKLWLKFKSKVRTRQACISYRYLCACMVICIEEQRKPRGRLGRQRWQQRAKSCWGRGGVGGWWGECRRGKRRQSCQGASVFPERAVNANYCFSAHEWLVTWHSGHVVVQSPSRLRLFVMPWTAAGPAAVASPWP